MTTRKRSRGAGRGSVAGAGRGPAGAERPPARPAPGALPLSPPASPPPRWENAAGGALWYLAAALAVVARSFTVALNTDVWFHLAAGRLIWEQRGVPAVDSWSYTAAGHRWINHEWLSDLVLYGWSRAFGLDALMAWQWLLLLAAFLLLFRLLVRLGSSHLAGFLILALTLQVAAPFFDLRPQLWSLLCFVLLVQLALIREGPLWLLPVVFLFWANLHAGVVFGLGALAVIVAIVAIVAIGATGATAEIGARRRRLRRLGLTALACLGAVLINPFGVEILTYPLRLLSASAASRELISEWRPPFAAGGIHAALYPWAIAAFAAAALVVLLSRPAPERGELSWGALALGALTLAMSLESRRFVPLFALASSLTLALAVGEVLRRRRSGVPRTAGPRAAGPRRLALAGIPLLAVLIGAAALWPELRLPHPFRRTTMSFAQPIDTMNFVEANRLGGKVFAYWFFSGYVDFRTGGRLRVFIDPRSETLFSEATEVAYSRVQFMQDDWQRTLEELGPQWVLWSRHGWDQGRLPRELMASGRWRRVHQDAWSVLLARTGQPLPEPLAAAPDSPYRDWAAAQDAYAARDLRGAERLLARALDREPELAPACEDLINVQEQLGEDAAAAATADRCRSLLSQATAAVVAAPQ